MTREQREEYAKLHKDCSDLITLAANAKRQLIPEEKTAQDARFARMDVLKAQHDEEHRLAALAFDSGNAGDGRSQAEREVRLELTGQNSIYTRKMTAEEMVTFRRSANHYLRTGEIDQFTITAAGNGILVPTSVMPPEVIRRNFNPFRALLAATGYEVLSTTGTEVIVLPVFDDTGVTGDTPAENATSEDVADFNTTSSVSLGATLYSSKQRWFSNTVLNANGFDMLGYITPIIQKSVDKAQESAFTSSLIGLAAPTYTSTYSGAGAHAALQYQDLINWEHTLNVAYRMDAGFILSDSLYKSARSLVDSNNRPIMDLDPQNVFQSMIHRKPVFVGDYVPATGTAGNIAGAFVSGDAIKLRDVIPQRLVRYVNVPQNPDQTGFQLFANGAIGFVTQGIALFKCGTTNT